MAEGEGQRTNPFLVDYGDIDLDKDFEEFKKNVDEAIEESGDLLKAATDILTEYGDADPDDYERLATKLRKKIKVKTELKQVEKGDFQCRYCSHKNTCYTPKGVPKEL